MGLFSLFSSGNEKKAARSQMQGYEQGLAEFNNYANRGLGSAVTYGNRALGEYNGLQNFGNNSLSAYSDALGFNGAEGTARAQGAFQASPGYEFQLNQGLGALERRAASRGMLGSGNTSLDTLGYAQGLANQEYQGYLDRLLGGVGVAQNTANARSGIQTGLGNTALGVRLAQGEAGNQAAIGKGNAWANYELSKNQTGANILGGFSLAGKLLGFGA